MSEREDFYDVDIAPALLVLGRKCQAAGLSLVAVVEWEPGQTGETTFLSGESSFAVRMVQAAVKAHGNVDSLMFAIMRYARDNGHSSAILHQLGVPLTPNEPS